MQELENKLREIFTKKAPYQLPESTKLIIIKYMPGLTLTGGVISSLAAVSMYGSITWASRFDNFTSYINNMPGMQRYYGSAVPGVSPIFWVSLLLMLSLATIFFAAFTTIKARSRRGWSMLYLVSLLNILYAIVYFIAVARLDWFISSILISIICLYTLFQLEGYYLDSSKSNRQTKKITK